MSSPSSVAPRSPLLARQASSSSPDVKDARSVAALEERGAEGVEEDNKEKEDVHVQVVVDAPTRNAPTRNGGAADRNELDDDEAWTTIRRKTHWSVRWFLRVPASVACIMGNGINFSLSLFIVPLADEVPGFTPTLVVGVPAVCELNFSSF